MERRIPFIALLFPMWVMAQTPMEQGDEDLANAGGSPSTTVEPAPFKTALFMIRSERIAEAIPLLTRELAEHPENGKAWYYRGVCHANSGGAVAALNDLDRALELMPGDPNALLRRGEVLSATHEDERALKDLREVLRSYPEGPIAEHALLGIGEIQMRTGDVPAAMSTYDRFVRIAPTDARGWFNRGIARAKTGDHRMAVEDLTRAIQLDGWMHRAYASRAIELVHLDRKDEACPDLARARELGDESVAELIAIYCE